ncbi:MFS transporter [Ophiocordyceps camponoti-floridani]|uniref:MFS transporter n=1 Tax=Ophiocordyceps camponoti-floridani TaxID=2030778 RepID=A0A8H4VFA0_9HYPO|nr:MFS transporter [Ophiocordyceps camponoti-floridani]
MAPWRNRDSFPSFTAVKRPVSGIQDLHVETVNRVGVGRDGSPWEVAGRAKSSLCQLRGHPWTQILLISLICFCLPGMYNALTGLGGCGQVDATVAANATVALLSTMAITSLFIAGPLFAWAGPRISLMAGGWTYALYSGSLLNFNRTGNGALVIASGAMLGVGASLLWIVQGAIMTSYVDESRKGRAIAIFWVVFNLGGGIGSLASFGLNYNSGKGSVSSSTYVALMIVMLFGWSLALLLCSPERVRGTMTTASTPKAARPWHRIIIDVVRSSSRVLCTWRVACMLPLFFSANVFYSYQQNSVNGDTFNIHTRSLNGAFYWLAQMVGGLFIGLILDLPCLGRRGRARLGWAIAFVFGLIIWGGGYQFQLWQNDRLASGQRQDVDFKDSALAAGPMALYTFYGAYDALWQAFAYWLIGTESNNPTRAAILVGAYKGLQAAGGSIAWRVNAFSVSPMTELAMNWGLCIGSLLVVLPVVWTVSASTDDEGEQPEKGADEGLKGDDTQV